MVADTRMIRPVELDVSSFHSCQSMESDERSTVNSQLRRKRPHRRVHFSSSSIEDGSVEEEVAIFPRLTSFKAELYYTKKDIRNFQRCAKRAAYLLMASAPQVADSVHQLSDMAGPGDKTQPVFECLLNIYETDARGVERLVSRRLSEHRRTAVKSILQVQKKTDDPIERDVLMRICSLQLSRRARMFAERLGAADAVDAMCSSY
jgi:hypothetical protein